MRIDKYARRPIEDVLDVGAGRDLQVRVDRARVTGLDVSLEAMRGNVQLAERIAADAQSYEFKPYSYDAVVCWNCLEHLDRPLPAVRGMASAVRPGGLLLLAYPDPMVPKSLLAKLTPHWFHRVAYRLLRSDELDEPFPTYLRWSLRPSRLTAFVTQLGLELLDEKRESDRAYERLPSPLRLAWQGLCAVFRVVTGTNPHASEVRLVFRRPIS